MKPPLGFFKALRLAKLSGNQQGIVEKHFPVVNAGGYFLKVNLDLSHGVRIRSVKLGSRVT